MTYKIEWAASAARELRQLDKPVARRIAVAVTALSHDPRPRGAKVLIGQPSGVMRIRVGDYRVVYVIEDAHVLITVVRVAHRRGVYRRL
ncbi:MAG: type II toxin-antitoxin system RelE family toxin [Thermocrispum sp.]